MGRCSKIGSVGSGTESMEPDYLFAPCAVHGLAYRLGGGVVAPAGGGGGFRGGFASFCAVVLGLQRDANSDKTKNDEFSASGMTVCVFGWSHLPATPRRGPHAPGAVG